MEDDRGVASMKIKHVLGMAALLCMVILSGCGNENTAQDGSVPKKITIAYQGGIGYAPVHVLEKKKLIEKNYNGKVEVNFVKLDSGAAVNEGIIGGTIDIGCMGLAPAISGVSKGLPYKAVANLSSQAHGLMSNDLEIGSLKQIKPQDKIALVSTGSIQHILLGMAAEKILGDAHALDNNIQRMSHAEGMAALEAGAVKLHLTSAPFIYQERALGRYVELPEVKEVWPQGNTFLVAMAAISLQKDAELFNAVQKAFVQAVDFINENPEETLTIEEAYLQLDKDVIKSYLNEPDSKFFSDIRGMGKMASFMKRAGFIDKEVSKEQFAYGGVDCE